MAKLIEKLAKGKDETIYTPVDIGEVAAWNESMSQARNAAISEQLTDKMQTTNMGLGSGEHVGRPQYPASTRITATKNGQA